MAKNVAIPEEVIINKIYHIRDRKVMLSHDLAELYQVETKRLNERVRRNQGNLKDICSGLHKKNISL